MEHERLEARQVDNGPLPILQVKQKTFNVAQLKILKKTLGFLAKVERTQQRLMATGRPDEPRIRCKTKKLPKPVVRARILKVACSQKVKLLKNHGNI